MLKLISLPVHTARHAFYFVCALEDGSKQVWGFVDLPGRSIIMSPARGGEQGLEECTDVLSESAAFQVSP